MTKKIKIFDLSEQYNNKNLSDEIDKRFKDILHSGQYILGKNVKKLEKKFALILNAKYAVSCNSGTDALILSLRACSIGSGDEVITSPFTYFATAEAIALVGAKPIFADINPHTFNINYKNVESLITKKTKAIMPVHIFGQAAEMIPLKKLCRKYNLKLIEDCAQSFGAKIDKTYTGTLGDFGCFSFFPTKNLGCAGDGGIILTNNSRYANTLMKLRNHGGLTRNIHEYIGYNSRLDELQAAVLLAKLKIVNQLNRNRIKIASLYNKLITNKKIIKPYKKNNYFHVYNQYTIKVENRLKFINHLEKFSIPYGIYYPIPIYKQKAFSGFRYKYKLNNTERICKQCISIPIYPELSNDKVEYISNIINKY